MPTQPTLHIGQTAAGKGKHAIRLTLRRPGQPDLEAEALAAALTRLAEMNALAGIRDAAAWEREARQERELPGRSA